MDKLLLLPAAGPWDYAALACTGIAAIAGHWRFTEKAQAEIAEVLKENTGKVLRVLFKGYG